MAYETLVSVELMEDHTVDSHIWWFNGIPFMPVTQLSILELDNDGLKTALIISLLTDRRLPFDGNEPLTKDDRRGWWADNTLEGNDLIGSRLWTLARRRMITDNIIPEAEGILKEALKWLIDDGVAEFVKITVTRPDNYSLFFDIRVKKPGDEKLSKYFFIWRVAGNIVGT